MLAFLLHLLARALPAPPQRTGMAVRLLAVRGDPRQRRDDVALGWSPRKVKGRWPSGFG